MLINIFLIYYDSQTMMFKLILLGKNLKPEKKNLHHLKDEILCYVSIVKKETKHIQNVLGLTIPRSFFDVLKNLLKLIGCRSSSSSHCLQFSRSLMWPIWHVPRNSDGQICHWRMWYSWDWTIEFQYQKYKNILNTFVYTDQIFDADKRK